MTVALDLSLIASTLLTRTPAWARVGLTAPSERLRGQAANELASVLACALEGQTDVRDERQMALPL